MALSWDHIIIGAGSAGCALAYELAKDGDRKVLLVEAGASDSSIYISVPALQARAIRRHDWGYVSAPDPTRNNRTESWERGRVLGGSSSVNGMMYVRGARADFDRWEQLGNRGWGYRDVLTVFRDMERSDQTGELRGRTGPLTVRTASDVHPLTQAFIKSAIAHGHMFNGDYNGESQGGVAYAQLSQTNGFRCSAARAFVKPLLGHGNFKLLLRATVHRIELKAGRATGVVFSRNGSLHTEAGRQIIVCAGAINSPKLLMSSGIGDPIELERAGLPVYVAAVEVGKNLQDHPVLKMTYRTKVPSHNLTEGIPQKLRILHQFLARRSGPIANLFEATAFLRTTPQLAEPDIQLHFLALGYGQTTGGTNRVLNYPSVTVLLNGSHPTSRGCVRLASADPREAPKIECRLLADSSDVETLARGVDIVRGIMNICPMADLIEAESAPGRGTAEEASLRAYIRNNAQIAYHAAGTCRMGVDGSAVVNPELRVNGVENLWVADASIMPDLISGNTNAACMMIGMKLGRHLKTDRS